MSKLLWLTFWSSHLLLLLAACGNADPSTSTTGPVSISTNHTIYAPTDAIEVSVTNHLPVSIFAYDTRAGCSILDLQIQLNGLWQDTQVARCSLGRPPMLVEIPATKVYTATIKAGSPGLVQAAFLAGTYRLLLTYSTSATRSPQSTIQSTTTIYSATFSVTNSA